MRFWLVVAVLFIILAFSLTAVKWWHTPAYVKPLSSNLKIIGAIDFDNNHGVDINTIREGKDVLLVLLNSDYKSQYVPAHPKTNQFYAKPFDLVNFDNGTGFIDEHSDLWPYLAVLIYSENGANYHLSRPEDVGIARIQTEHISAHGDHNVFFNNGQVRILYEVSRFS